MYLLRLACGQDSVKSGGTTGDLFFANLMVLLLGEEDNPIRLYFYLSGPIFISGKTVPFQTVSENYGFYLFMVSLC